MLLAHPSRLVVTEDSYVRDMPFRAFRKIVDELNMANMWERVAEIIPARPESIFGNEPFVARYTATHLMRFESKNRTSGGNAAKSMLTDWATQNVCIKHLMGVLHQCRLWKLVTYIEQEVLARAPVCRSTAFLLRSLQLQRENSELETSFVRNLLQEVMGQEEMSQALLADNSLGGLAPPSGEGDGDTLEDRLQHAGESGHRAPNKPCSQTSVCEAAQGLEDSLLNKGTPPPEPCPDTPPNFHLLKQISFQILRHITKNFDKRAVSDGGSVLGEGGFGTVYLASFHTGFKVAVKYLRENNEDSMQQFKTEVETLCAFKHVNVVQLLGYSVDGEARCLLYQFMPQGALDDRLACKNDTLPLSAHTRMDITLGTARGIVFLNEGGLTHRDIKPANILLDHDFTPKVSDLATARASHSSTSAVIGSAPYMAPEVHNFVIHPRLDAFSFGVVVLELITGLPVLDDTREDPNLVYMVKELCGSAEDEEEGDEEDEAGTIQELVDNKAGAWPEGSVDGLYHVADRCLTMEAARRPTVGQVLADLEAVCAHD